jgi:hypothetical protein
MPALSAVDGPARSVVKGNTATHSAAFASEKTERKASCLPSGGIKLLVQVDPQNPRKKGNRWRKRQKQNDSPDDILGDPPPGDGPDEQGEQRKDRHAQAVADVHRAKEISRLALIPEMAHRALFVHLREAEENGMMKDFSNTATRTPLVKNIVERGNHAGFHGTASV